MKLGTKECNDKLLRYQCKSKSEELVIELLLIPDEDDEAFGIMTDKICDSLSEEEIRNIASVVRRIRKELGIES